MDQRFIQVVFFDLGDTLVETPGRRWVPGAKGVLATLRARQLRLGLISNTGDLSRDQLLSLLPEDFTWEPFEPGLIVLSSEVGVAKPSPAIFAQAVARTGVDAGACLFCTEDLPDALVAQAAGMRAARVQRPPASDVEGLAQALTRAGLLAQGGPPHPAAPPRTVASPAVPEAGRIRQLMAVPPPQHDLNWLKASLQAAAELELATIPPYLCAMWSVQDESDPVHDLIRDVVLEEMGHLGLVCNMLTTVGGTPVLNAPTSVPQYPGPLPGGVRPAVRVALCGLTKAVVTDVFMEIEYPENGPVAFAFGETYPTIGAFYTAVGEAFGQLPAAAITGERQLVSPGVGLFKIKTADDVRKAVQQIKEQGEGTSQSPQAEDFGGDLAHYYKFAEVFHERSLVKNVAGQWKYEGDPLPFPAAFPMAEVPPGGYAESAAFDRLYTAVLDKLQAAWAGGGQAQLSGAVAAMFALREPARQLMQTPLPAGPGNFGPSFRLLADGPPHA